MKIGISLLCEQPNRKTGLTSLFTCFAREALAIYPDLEILLLCAEGQSLDVESPRISTKSGFPANDRLVKRLATEHLLIGTSAKSLGCDVILTTGLVPLIPRLPVAMHLLTLHHLNAENHIGSLRSKYRTWATASGVKRADLIITNTRFACNQILANFPEAAPKLLQSYEGLDHSSFHPNGTANEKAMLRERFGIAGTYFFWCSNFYPYKQAELMMEAWCDLPETIRKSAPMVMVGGGGWGGSKRRTMEIAERRGLADQVKMLGWVSDEEIPVLFRHAGVFVHPSREETFGRSVLEAMASGVPTVVQDIPVMHEVTGGHSIIVDYNDRQAATAAMEQALLNSETRQRLIEGGLGRAAEFSFTRLACERVEALRRMLGMPPGPGADLHPPVYADSFS